MKVVVVGRFRLHVPTRYRLEAVILTQFSPSVAIRTKSTLPSSNKRLRRTDHSGHGVCGGRLNGHYTDDTSLRTFQESIDEWTTVIDTNDKQQLVSLKISNTSYKPLKTKPFFLFAINDLIVAVINSNKNDVSKLEKHTDGF